MAMSAQQIAIRALRAAGWNRVGYDQWIAMNGQTWPNWMHAYCVLCSDRRKGVKHG